MDSVRTIKITDHFIFASKYENMTMESERKRLETLKGLGNLLETRKAELAEEKAKAEPDMARIGRLHAIVGNLQGTLKAKQR